MPWDGAGCHKNIFIGGRKNRAKISLLSRPEAEEREEEKGLRKLQGLALRSTTNCDFIPPLIPAQLRSPRPSFNPWPSPIHSSTKGPSTAGDFSSPDFEEIYEPPRSDGLADSLGGRAPRPVRKIVPYVYLKPYIRRALLVTPLNIHNPDISRRHVAIQIVSDVSPESL